MQGHAGDDNPREEMRHVSGSLSEALEPFEGQLVEEQRQDNPGGKADQQVKQVQHDGVTQRIEEVAVGKSLDEILKASVIRPWHLPNVLDEAELFERDLDISHRYIAKNHEISDG